MAPWDERLAQWDAAAAYRADHLPEETFGRWLLRRACLSEALRAEAGRVVRSVSLATRFCWRCDEPATRTLTWEQPFTVLNACDTCPLPVSLSSDAHTATDLLLAPLVRLLRGAS